MKSPLQILSLEDDTADADLILATLAQANIKCKAVQVETEQDFVDALERGGLDLILSDHSLPTFDGVSALKLALAKAPDVPFIFVSGAMGEDLAIELIKGGATDYVFKNRLSRLAPAVCRAIAEAEERTARREASSKAEQYTLELQIKHDELIEALESARQANLVKNRFLANMSHELRTPLNAIIGLSEILHDDLLGDLSPQQKEYMGDILASGHHLLDLVNNLLDLERVELGKIEFSPQVVDVPRLLKEVCNVLHTLADENGVNVSVTADPALSAVTTDPIRLRQIVYNYVSNAIKFSPAESRVRVRAIPDEGRRFRVEVADDGPGIKSEELSLLYNDFHRLDRTQKRPGQGAGLGLALVKRIVEAQGGTVGVQSVPGAGSTFYAVLPNGL
jgi:signal transduction histidine kinase